MFWLLVVVVVAVVQVEVELVDGRIKLVLLLEVVQLVLLLLLEVLLLQLVVLLVLVVRLVRVVRVLVKWGRVMRDRVLLVQVVLVVGAQLARLAGETRARGTEQRQFTGLLGRE